jgi:hypothetical protein
MHVLLPVSQRLTSVLWAALREAPYPIVRNRKRGLCRGCLMLAEGFRRDREGSRPQSIQPVNWSTLPGVSERATGDKTIASFKPNRWRECDPSRGIAMNEKPEPGPAMRRCLAGSAASDRQDPNPLPF